jgi:hypothetical protein
MLLENICKKIVCSALIAGSALLNGCAGYYKQGEKYDKEGFYLESELRGGCEYMRYRANLGNKIQTTPVHPDDSGFLTGSTKAEAKRGWDVPVRGGAGVSVGTPELRVGVGLDARINPLAQTEYREGIYKTAQQSSDTRPPELGSFVYTIIKPKWFTAIPVVTAEANLGDLKIRAEAGMPYGGFEVESGHDRWGEWEAAQRESWKGFGRRYTLGADIPVSEGIRVGIFGGVEKYNVEFDGEKGKINAILGAVQLGLDF